MRIAVLSTVLSLCAVLRLPAQNLVQNPGFELGPDRWSLFNPPGYENSGAKVEIVNDATRRDSRVARLSCTSVARFSFSSQTRIPVTPGMRFRVKAVYRAEPGAQLDHDSPGLVLRTSFEPQSKAGASIPPLHIGPLGSVSTVVGKPMAIPSLPLEWTEINAVIEVPPLASIMTLNILVWRMRGTLLVDDVSIELISDESTLAAAVLNIPTDEIDSGWRPWSGFTLLALTNPDFELGLTGWDYERDNRMSQPSPHAAKSGGFGLRVKDADSTRGSSVLSDFIPVRPEARYYMGWWARINQGHGIAVYLRFYDARKRELTSEKNKTEIKRVIPTEEADFRQYSLEADALRQSAFVRIWIHSFTADQVVADFDDFVLMEIAR